MDDPTSTAYHAWVITPTATGSHILTEETQQGPYWEDIAKRVPDGLWAFHQEWVETLGAIAEADAERARS